MKVGIYSFILNNALHYFIYYVSAIIVSFIVKGRVKSDFPNCILPSDIT